MQEQAADKAAKEGGGISRERTWEEATPEQKVERLRVQLRLFMELVNTQQQLIERLMVHQHAPDGSMLVPMHRSGLGEPNRPIGYRPRDPLA